VQKPFKLYRMKWVKWYEPSEDTFLVDNVDLRGDDRELVAEIKSPLDTTAEELALYLDDEAESANYHNLVGAYSGLADLLNTISGSSVACRALWFIAKCGGFTELSGWTSQEEDEN